MCNDELGVCTCCHGNREEQREKMRSTEHLLMLAQAEKMRLLAEQASVFLFMVSSCFLFMVSSTNRFI